MSALCRKPCAVLTRHLVPRLQELQRKRYRKLHECPTTGFLYKEVEDRHWHQHHHHRHYHHHHHHILHLSAERILCNRLINNSIHYCYKSPAYLLTLFRPFHILTLINFFLPKKRASYFKTKTLHFQLLLTVLPEETKNLVDQPLCEKLLKDGKRWHVN